MNLGILMVQGIVNSYGTVVMTAFAAGVKIDAFAYMPAQEYGNAFSTFLAQNYGANKMDRFRQGIRVGIITSAVYCAAASLVLWIFAKKLMLIFIPESKTEIINIGVQYLHIEGAFYIGIGILFLLYGLYRAMGRPQMSLILTIISLGTRVVIAKAVSVSDMVGCADRLVSCRYCRNYLLLILQKKSETLKMPPGTFVSNGILLYNGPPN